MVYNWLQEYAEEIEKLRKEVHRYRNELINREGNFNRMFTEQQPVCVERRPAKIAFSHDNLRYNREKSQVRNR